jgi:hypothetical protein
LIFLESYIYCAPKGVNYMQKWAMFFRNGINGLQSIFGLDPLTRFGVTPWSETVRILTARRLLESGCPSDRGDSDSAPVDEAEPWKRLDS